MSEKTIADRVAKAAALVYGVEAGGVKPSDNLFEKYGGDSLDQIEFVMTVEQICGVDITPEQSMKVVTIGDAVTLVESLIVAKAQVA